MRAIVQYSLSPWCKSQVGRIRITPTDGEQKALTVNSQHIERHRDLNGTESGVRLQQNAAMGANRTQLDLS